MEENINEINDSAEKSTDQLDEEIINDNDLNNSSEENAETKVFTQADIDALQSQIDELKQHKPAEKSEAEIRLQEKAESLWQKQVALELKESGLEVFSEFVKAEVDDVETLEKQISKLKEIVGTLELSSSYQPTHHQSADAFSIAKKNKDVKSMISAKINL